MLIGLSPSQTTTLKLVLEIASTPNRASFQQQPQKPELSTWTPHKHDSTVEAHTSIDENVNQIKEWKTRPENHLLQTYTSERTTLHRQAVT